MSTVQYPDIIKAIQDPAHCYGVERLAAHFDRRPSAIYSVLNPWGDRSVAKLGLEDAVEIMRLTGDIGGLEVMAAKFGMALLPIVARADKPSVALELLDAVRAIADLQSVLETPGLSKDEATRAIGSFVSEAQQILDAWTREHPATESCSGNVFRNGKWVREAA